jgi:hypothetical protein
MTLIDDVCRKMDTIHRLHEAEMRRIKRRQWIMRAILVIVALWALTACSQPWMDIRYWPTCGRCETRCAP